MEEIEVWTVDGSQVTRLAKSNRMESELLLEDVLVENPGLLLEDLILVGRQTPTEGGPLDLLGVDGDGRLVVFELKRGTLNREAVAQIIDYASDLDGMELDALASYISEKSGSHGIDRIDDFPDWYGQQEFEDSESLESLKPLRMVLVGLGVDDRTERMTRFLAENSGMDISLLTFHGFEYDGKTILAKRVEVEGSEDGDTQPARRRLSRAERRNLLSSRAREFGVHELFDDVRAMFRENWLGSGEYPIRIGMNVTLPHRAHSGRRVRRRYARVGPNNRGVNIVFYPWAVELCTNEFRKPIEQIPFQTWPKGREAQALKVPNTEIQFSLTADEWETHKDRLTELARAVYEAWENRDTEDESE